MDASAYVNQTRSELAVLCSSMRLLYLGIACATSILPGVALRYYAIRVDSR